MRFKASLIALLAALPLAAAPSPAAAAEGGRWGGGWATAVQRPAATPWFPNWSEQGFDDHSVRQVIRTSVSGTQLRIRLSNAYGATPLRLTGATIAKTATGAAVRPGTTRKLTFARSASVTVPAGGQTASDPVRLPVRALERLTVTLYFQRPTGPATFHSIAMATSYRAKGDHRHDTGGAAYTETSLSRYYLSGLDVSGRKNTVVTFGDSITDGYGATNDADDRYPDRLAERLAASGTPVVNAGIGGNRVLNDSACFGEKATTRFKRDALAQPGVRTVIVLEGINDILFEQDPSACAAPNPRVTAGELIDGHRALIRAARARGVRIVGGTLPPFKGSALYSEHGEGVRQAVNHWIRTAGAYDAVADFDRALADPRDAGQLLPAYDSGDGLHPSPAGYQAMADAVDLSALIGK
ncbi:SGNH/GDSL hydrolase family protein [Nonomuraea candida]|uniref:SGNH/GDSL hydrolase family protein n=1 Tax=Nonomuraea candida TaxID=359159 RepID=UPI0005B94199|nr:SGNH/GDSL hydrolase family protein [Nonomuraea candida]